MKSPVKNLSLVTLAVFVAVGVSVEGHSQTIVSVDPTQSWVGFMNVFSLPANGGAYQFGSSWGTSDLPASFSGTTLTLSPNVNTYNATDPYWVNPDGSGNKTCDASFYVQNDALAGQTVTFVGDNLSYSLVSPYTSVAFIKDFAPDYSSFTQTTISLATLGDFSLNLATTVGDHIQYGFETIGPDANPATVASLGFATVGPVPEPSTIGLLGLGSIAALSVIRRRNK